MKYSMREYRKKEHKAIRQKEIDQNMRNSTTVWKKFIIIMRKLATNCAIHILFTSIPGFLQSVNILKLFRP